MKMTNEQIIEMARRIGFPSAVLLDMYGNTLAALCDSEILELENIKRFAQLVRNAALEEAAEVCGSKAPVIGNTNYGTACNECAGAIMSLKS